MDEKDCFLCNHWSYCIFLYDRNIAVNEEFYLNVEARKVADKRAKSLFSPIYASIESISEILPMIPVQHFLSRLATNQRSNGMQRNIKENHVEKERLELTERVN